MKAARMVRGVGLNDADYSVQKKEEMPYVNGKRKQRVVWTCPYYARWKGMIERCYSTKMQERNPTYKGCTVSDEWLTFSKFKIWMESQCWEGKHLDKDILIEGNKVYSSDTCVFVSREVNNFTNDHGSGRGEWLIGVYWNKKLNKFQASVGNPFTNKRDHLGLFACEQEAHEAWLKRKLELAKELASIQEDPRVAKALIERYSKPQEQN